MNDSRDLSGILSDMANHSPGRIFIRFKGRKITFRETNDLASHVAFSLKKEGLKEGDCIALLSQNCPEYVAAYFGIIRARGIVIPVNTMLGSKEIEYILSDGKAAICLYGPEFNTMAESISTSLKGINFIPLTKTVAPASGKSASDIEPMNPDNIAVILYTSGTTGRPKGAMLTHKNIIADAVAATSVFSVSNKDRFIVFLPLFHSFTFTVCVIIPVLCGASITLLTSVKPFSEVLKRLVIDRITVFTAIPTIYNILAKKKMPFIFKLLLNLRVCISGAAPLPLKTIEDFEKSFKVPLIEGYGLTEASPVVSANPFDSKKRKPGTVGLPLPGIEVKVVDDIGNALPLNTPGELVVKGPNVMKGYLNRPEETDATIKDGWLYTGDMAVIDTEGYIRIVDRKKDMIIVDGMNIYPGEVENVLQSHHAVEDCAMVGISPEEGKELPVMFVVKRSGYSVSDKELKEFLSEHIASYKMPRRIIFLEELPRTPTGKVLKKELRQWKKT